MANVRFPVEPELEAAGGRGGESCHENAAQKRSRQDAELVDRYQGGDIETIKTEMVRLYLTEDGGDFSKELTEHAEAIAAGTRISESDLRAGESVSTTAAWQVGPEGADSGSNSV